MEIDQPVDGDSSPCFRWHQRAALTIARRESPPQTAPHLFSNAIGEAIDILRSLPVAFLAVSFGLRGGWSGGNYPKSDLELRFIRAVH